MIGGSLLPVRALVVLPNSGLRRVSLPSRRQFRIMQSQPASEDSEELQSQACLAVLMPIYNEIATLREVITQVLTQPEVAELIAVDDCSTDGSAELLREMSQSEPRIRPLFHPVNRGKGAALRTGLRTVAQPFVIVQDADLEYDPSDYAKLLQPLVQQEADVVYGSRYLDMRVRKEAYFGQYFANQILTFLTNSLTRLNTTDMATCYKVFRSEIFSRIEIEEAGFGVCPELTVKIGRLGLRFVELPISYSPRRFADGKKITWKDGLKAIECIVKYGLRRPNNDDRTKA
jgi:glycosyltransferase involved in cell wall biosynthesis